MIILFLVLLSLNFSEFDSFILNTKNPRIIHKNKGLKIEIQFVNYAKKLDVQSDHEKPQRVRKVLKLSSFPSKKRFNKQNVIPPGTSSTSLSKSNKIWRLFNVEVPLDQDPGKDDIGIHDNLLIAIGKQIGIDIKSNLLNSNFKVIKKSFDGRWKKSGQPKFVYTVDVDLTSISKTNVKIYPKEGSIEEIIKEEDTVDNVLSEYQEIHKNNEKNRIVIVGAGPAGKLYINILQSTA